MSLKIDQTTKAQAMEYADNESEINGFRRGSEQWQNAVNEYVKFAIGTMSVGRNPRTFRYKAFMSYYNCFSDTGFSGKVAKNYISQSGQKGIKLSDVQNRILASVTNLSKLYENGILGIKTTTTGGEQGQIPNDKMSDTQLPDKEDFSGDYEKHVNFVVRNWIIRDLVSAIVLELLRPFFEMTKEDFDAITKAIRIDEAKLADIKLQREEYLNAIQKVMRSKMASVNIKKVLLG